MQFAAFLEMFLLFLFGLFYFYNFASRNKNMQKQ